MSCAVVLLDQLCLLRFFHVAVAIAKHLAQKEIDHVMHSPVILRQPSGS